MTREGDELMAAHNDTENSKHADHNHTHGGALGERTELAFAILSAVALAIGWLIETAWAKEPAIVAYVAAYMFGGFFTAEQQVDSYAQVMACNTPAFNQFFHRMLDQGVYLAPASYEAGFMSSAHSDRDIADTVAAAAMAKLSL